MLSTVDIVQAARTVKLLEAGSACMRADMHVCKYMTYVVCVCMYVCLCVCVCVCKT